MGTERDALFLGTENALLDFLPLERSASPSIGDAQLQGLVADDEIADMVRQLQGLSVDEYIAETISRAEAKDYPDAKSLIKRLRARLVREVDMGPLYAAELIFEGADDKRRRVGVLAQNRSVANGVWGPQHHLRAVRLVREYCDHNLPIITFIDTPGADANAEANRHNQAHSISRLITEMADMHIPTIGIVFGLGYSGGAIPLATTNLLFAVRHGVLNTIQPKGLASIAQQYNLSWQESARYVGLSAVELCHKGIIDGVIDWGGARDDPGVFIQLMDSGIAAIESAAVSLVAADERIWQHHRRNVQRFIRPPEELQKLRSVADLPVAGRAIHHSNIFGYSCQYLRYLGQRRRICSASLGSYGRLAGEEIPAGELDQRTEQERRLGFERWLADPDHLIYNDGLRKSWEEYSSRHDDLDLERGPVSTFFLGDPQQRYREARRTLCFLVALYLYNRWKADAPYNIAAISALMRKKRGDGGLHKQETRDLNLLHLLYARDLRQQMLEEFDNILLFDRLYDSLVDNFAVIAEDTRESHILPEQRVQELLEQPLKGGGSTENFLEWLQYFARHKGRADFLATVEEWKRLHYPRLSDSLLVLLTFLFDTLVPSYLASRQEGGREFDGRINPVRIGKRKDFWNQLDIAYKDLLIQRLLGDYKRRKTCTVQAFKDRFFEGFEELSADLITANPLNFPGFRLSIERALRAETPPCGVVTGTARLRFGGRQKVGVLLSNIAFQAGAFDMAGAEKLCRLLLECAEQRLPLVCFISSGGMQTKEGPGALFSMAIANDRITRFVRDNDLPVIVFGFGDCTGGSQASFVTHPLVQNYYFSGADMPFAGRVVVPSFLPVQATLSNYLSGAPGAMRGLVSHPFHEQLDGQLRAIDPSIAVPDESVEQAIERILEGKYLPQAGKRQSRKMLSKDLMRPIKTVLIHARGCTAVKLIRIARQLRKRVVLVASDPDMDSVPADMLGRGDELVCLGGQTSDESYLNAGSVLAIAERQRVCALHPGIGFLSEHDHFARLCRSRRINFIGPYAGSMEVMGNKSNAIHTAMKSGVPVVPGSHGILTSAAATAQVADEVGYPVLLKAVHGGGGKGIELVRDAGHIEAAFHKVQSEAQAAFGNPDLYLEKFVGSMRHIEVQILRDSRGNCKVLGLRDCSVQRNNQKVLEESASTLLPAKLEQDAYRHARSLAEAVNYLGAGTVEFIYDIPARAIYFMEMNTRLQVEHPVTEWTTGISIVGEQFRIAEGRSIQQLEATPKGFAIEARIVAEKAVLDGEVLDFRPTPGLITECQLPEADHLEVISMAGTGKRVSPFYDSLIAQIIAHGKDRSQAIRRLRAALRATVIQGICTNIPLLVRILGDKRFRDGDYDTGYLPDFLARTNRKTLLAEMAASGASQDGGLDITIKGSDELKVLSPGTGIFYAAPAPTEPAYVAQGDTVDVHDTLCQIEAMKLFTHIQLSSLGGERPLYDPEASYQITRINQSDGAQVNAGDLLFVVRPQGPARAAKGD